MKFLIEARLRVRRILKNVTKQLRSAWPKFRRLPNRNQLTPPKNDQEFQRRLLAALEKKPRFWLFAVINSAFFLWLLTAIFLTIGSTYYTTYQACVRDATQIAEQFGKLNREQFYRIMDLKEVVEAANSMDEIRAKAKSPGYHFIEFQNRTGNDLVLESLRLMTRIELPLPPPYQPESKKEYDWETKKRYGGGIHGFIDKTVRDDELPAFRDFFENEFREAEYFFRTLTYLEYPHICSALTVVELMKGERPKIVLRQPAQTENVDEE